MDCIEKNEILVFSDGALQAIRREYDLDKPGRMDQALDVLEAWVKKQNHFNRTDFPRNYLERQIIFCKGSLERTKRRLDRGCTLKSLMPVYYKNIDLKTDYKDSNVLLDAILPKFTDDYYRIYVLKNIGQRFIYGLTNYYRFIFLLAEYILAHDYTKGFVLILDYTDTNLMELIKAFDIVEFREAMSMLIEGYGMRMKGMHLVTSSRAVNTLITIFKQILSAKLGERIQVHKNYESLHKVLPKDILPVELGGKERSIAELHEQWVDILSSEKHQEYFQEMKKFTTNEKFRQTDKLNEEYMGMPGTFKTLNLD